MDIFSFGVRFTDEKNCRLHFKEQRDREEVVCKLNRRYFGDHIFDRSIIDSITANGH